MMLKTLYLYELKKLFFSKVNLLALAGTVIMIVVLIISSNLSNIFISPDNNHSLSFQNMPG